MYDSRTFRWRENDGEQVILPTAIGATAATRVGDIALFTNGTEVDLWDVGRGTWSSTTLSESRLGPVATTVGPFALFAGGFPASDTVDVFDSRTGAWSTATLSEGRPVGAAVAVGSLALFGGSSSFASASDVVDIFDSTTGTWSTATLSVSRTLLTAASVGERALFIGGATLNPSTASAVLDVFDASTGQWSVDAIPTPTLRTSAVTLGSKIRVMGVGANPTVSVFDSFRSVWETESTASFGSFPFSGVESTAVAVGGQAVFAGGSILIQNPFMDVPVDAVNVYSDVIGAGYCTPSTPNSTGALGLLSVLGYPGAASQGSVLLQSTGLPPGTFGYALASMTAGGPMQPAGSQGTLCLAGAIGRFANQSFVADQNGAGSTLVNLSDVPSSMGSVAVQAGQTWSFQVWYRDSNPGPTSNLTGAIEVVFQ